MITDFNLLVAETSRVFGVDVVDILGPGRNQSASLARHVVMALWSDDHSFHDASRRCGRGCHSTSIWARQRVLNKAELDASFADMVADIARRCEHGAKTGKKIKNKVRYFENYA